MQALVIALLIQIMVVEYLIESRGLLQAGEIPGEAGILIRYLGHVAVCRVVVRSRPMAAATRSLSQTFARISMRSVS